MAQLTGPNLYKVVYQVVQPATTVIDPPTTVGPLVIIAVLAADVPSACVVAKTAANLQGTQTIRILQCEQRPEYTQIWQ